MSIDFAASQAATLNGMSICLLPRWHLAAHQTRAEHPYCRQRWPSARCRRPPPTPCRPLPCGCYSHWMFTWLDRNAASASHAATCTSDIAAPPETSSRNASFRQNKVSQCRVALLEHGGDCATDTTAIGWLGATALPVAAASLVAVATAGPAPAAAALPMPTGRLVALLDSSVAAGSAVPQLPAATCTCATESALPWPCCSSVSTFDISCSPSDSPGQSVGVDSTAIICCCIASTCIPQDIHVSLASIASQGDKLLVVAH
jgi:hypothetical protein